MAENDIALFLKEFSQTEQTLSDFHHLWRKKNMSCIMYCSPNPKEQIGFIRELLEYLVCGIDRGILIGKGPIFLLYTFFVVQPPSNWLRTNIPITTGEMFNLRSLVQAHCDRQEHDVVYLFNKLMTASAFEIIPSHNILAWSSKQVPKERFLNFAREIEENCEPTALHELFSDGSVIEKLHSLSLEYSSAKSDTNTRMDYVKTGLDVALKDLEMSYYQDGDENEDKDVLQRRLMVRETASSAPIDTRAPLDRKKRGKTAELPELAAFDSSL